METLLYKVVHSFPCAGLVEESFMAGVEGCHKHGRNTKWVVEGIIVMGIAYQHVGWRSA